MKQMQPQEYGGDDNPLDYEINYYEHLKNKLAEEIESMIISAEKVLHLPRSIHRKLTRDDVGREWKSIRTKTAQKIRILTMKNP